jgi:hypothetical protein
MSTAAVNARDYTSLDDYAYMPDLDDAGARAYYKEIHYKNEDPDPDETRIEVIQLVNLMRKGRWRNQLAAVVGHRGDYEIETNRVHTNALHFAAALVAMGVDPATLELRADEPALILTPAYKEHARVLLAHYGINKQATPPPSMSYPQLDLTAEQRADADRATMRALHTARVNANYINRGEAPPAPAPYDLIGQAVKAVADLVAPPARDVDDDEATPPADAKQRAPFFPPPPAAQTPLSAARAAMASNVNVQFTDAASTTNPIARVVKAVADAVAPPARAFPRADALPTLSPLPPFRPPAGPAPSWPAAQQTTNPLEQYANAEVYEFAKRRAEYEASLAVPPPPVARARDGDRVRVFERAQLDPWVLGLLRPIGNAAKAVADVVAPPPLRPLSTTTLVDDRQQRTQWRRRSRRWPTLAPAAKKQKKKAACKPACKPSSTKKKSSERAKAKAKHDRFYAGKARGKAQDARIAAEKKFTTAAAYKPNQGDFKGEKW